MSLILLLPLLTLACYLLYTHLISPLFVSPGCSIPRAHWSSAVSPLWLAHLRRDGKTGNSTITALHYPPSLPPRPILRLSPSEISVASLEGLRVIYLGAFEKSDFYSQFQNYGVPNLVSLLGNKPHTERKRMLSHVYSKSFVQGSAELQAFATRLVYEKLAPVLRAALATGEEWGELDAYTLNQALGLDFTSAFLLGAGAGTDFLSDLPAAREFMLKWKIKSRELPGHEIATRELEVFVLGLVRKSGAASAQDEQGIVLQQLKEHLGKGKTAADREQKELEEKQIASEIFDHLIAGVETVRITFTYLQHELSRHPAIQSALRAELRTLSPAISLPTPPSSTPHLLPSPKALDALPLLDAILRETLRLYPPSPAPLPRLVPASGTVLHGHPVPGGTTIGSSIRVLHLNPAVFPDPLAWVPGRWLAKKAGSEEEDDEEQERLKEMNRWFWAFGSGGRMCIGSHFAVVVLKLCVAALYVGVETRVRDDAGIEQEDAFLAGPRGDRLLLGVREVR